MTNEKSLLERADLSEVDAIIAEATTEPARLVAAVRTVRQLARSRLERCVA